MRCDECNHLQDHGRFCGRCGALLIPPKRDPIDAKDPDLPNFEPWLAPDSAEENDTEDVGAGRPWWQLVALIAGVAVIVVGLLRFTEVDETSEPEVPEETERRTDTPLPEEGSPLSGDRLFDHLTDIVLFFDDDTHVIRVDMDVGTATRWELPRGGVDDQPFPLIRLGEWLVVVSDGTASAVAAGRPDEQAERQLGNADYVLPDAHPDRLWLVIESEEDESFGSWTLVDASGTAIHEMRAVPGLTPLRGVPGVEGALALRDPSGGLYVYDVEQDALEPLGGSSRSLSDASQHHMVVCAYPCDTLLTFDEEREFSAALGINDVAHFFPGDVWLSGDGSVVAARAWVSQDDGRFNSELHIYDLANETLIDRIPVAFGRAHGVWTPDGRGFFYRAAMSGLPTDLVSYVAGDGFHTTELDAETVPPGTFTALPRSRPENLFSHRLQK